MHETAAVSGPAPSVLEQHQGITRDLLGRLFRATPRFWGVAVILGVLFLLGVAGVMVRLQGGFADRAPWGYYAGTFAFLLTAFQGAPVVSLATRAVKGHWRRPLARASEMFAVAGILSSLMFLPLLALLPPVQGRRTIWFEWPVGAPYLYDGLAVVLLAVCGLGLLYTAALPDLAAARDHTTGDRRALFARLALHWRGTPGQWWAQRAALGLFGAFYLLFLVFTHLLVSSDFLLSLVPGWKDSLLPAFHALGGLQSAVAITVVAIGILRWGAGLKDYLGMEQTWGLSKLLLALSLLYFYFTWSGFVTLWYGKAPSEQAVLTLLLFGPYQALFFMGFALNFVVPFLILLWNSARKSVLGPFLAAVSILIGTFADRLRLYVAAFSVQDIKAHELEHIPATRLPDGADLLIIVGMVAGAVLLYMLATRLLPVVSVWEMKELLHYRVVRPFMKTTVVVLAKPD